MAKMQADQEAARDRRSGLSDKQQRILEFLRAFLLEKDYPPSIRDIQQGCSISSTSVVDYNLKRLEERGYIPARPRGLTRDRAARRQRPAARLADRPADRRDRRRLADPDAAGHAAPRPTRRSP